MDLIPPEIVRVFPLPDSTLIDRGLEFALTFSEPMEQQSVEQAVLVNPITDTPYRYQWKGNTFFISSDEPMEANQTYVISVGTTARDRRNNGLHAPYSWAFSTGTQLDAGVVAGRVLNRTAAGRWSAWIYRENLSIHPNPLNTPSPMYRIPIDPAGNFELNHSVPGKYRIYVIADLNNDRRYHPGSDWIGIAAGSFMVSNEKPVLLRVFAAPDDTAAYRVSNVRAADQNHLDVRLNRFPERLSLDEIICTITRAGSDSLPVFHLYRDREEERLLHVITGRQKQGEKYVFSLRGVTDHLPPSPVEFEGSGKIDTTAPALLRHFAQRGTVSIRTPIELLWSEPPADSVISHYAVIRNQEQAAVAGKWSWSDPVAMRFYPDSLLRAGESYAITIDMPSIADRHGNQSPDSVFQLQFRMEDYTLYSIILGRVEDRRLHTGGPLFVELHTSKDRTLVEAKSVKADGSFNFEIVPPGTYLLWAYEDRNGDALFTPGSLQPFRWSERIVSYDEEISVRSGWDIEEIIIPFPE